MFNNLTIDDFLPAILVLLIEYFVIQPLQKYQPLKKVDANIKKRVIVAILVTVTLLLPLTLFQIIALWFAGFFNALAEARRVDIYVNAYGFLALIWGCTWMALIRPQLYRIKG